jgi:hypothetical protein
MSYRYPTHYNDDGFDGQEKFEPKDVPFNSLKSMASSVTNAMMPDLEVHKISLAEEKDGDQVLEACWIDPLEAMVRMAALSKYRDKLYAQFEPAYSESSPRVRVYSRANSGRVFEAAQDVDPDSSPLIAILASDKSYSGQHQGHPIYCKNL